MEIKGVFKQTFDNGIIQSSLDKSTKILSAWKPTSSDINIFNMDYIFNGLIICDRFWSIPLSFKLQESFLTLQWFCLV